MSQELNEWLTAMEESEQADGTNSEPPTARGNRTITRDEARGWIRAHHHCKQMQQRARLPASKRGPSTRKPNTPEVWRITRKWLNNTQQLNDIQEEGEERITDPRAIEGRLWESRKGIWATTPGHTEEAGRTLEHDFA